MLNPMPAPLSSSLLVSLALTLSFSFASTAQRALPEGHPPIPPWLSDTGHNEPYFPNPARPVPGKLPLNIDEKLHYYEPHQNNDENGKYKRSPCPAVNTLANRGYIPRSGKHVGYAEIAQASRDVFNFGDDNVSFLKSRQKRVVEIIILSTMLFPRWTLLLRSTKLQELACADIVSQIMLVLVPAFSAHPNATHLDLDQFAVRNHILISII